MDHRPLYHSLYPRCEVQYPPVAAQLLLDGAGSYSVCVTDNNRNLFSCMNVPLKVALGERGRLGTLEGNSPSSVPENLQHPVINNFNFQ